MTPHCQGVLKPPNSLSGNDQHRPDMMLGDLFRNASQQRLPDVAFAVGSKDDEGDILRLGSFIDFYKGDACFQLGTDRIAGKYQLSFRLCKSFSVDAVEFSHFILQIR